MCSDAARRRTLVGSTGGLGDLGDAGADAPAAPSAPSAPPRTSAAGGGGMKNDEAALAPLSWWRKPMRPAALAAGLEDALTAMRAAASRSSRT